MIYLKAAALLALLLTAAALVLFGTAYVIVAFSLPSGLFPVFIAVMAASTGIYMMILGELRKREKTRSSQGVSRLMEETLKDTRCPRPANGQPWDQCAGDCIKLGLCGCHVGFALGVTHSGGKQP